METLIIINRTAAKAKEAWPTIQRQLEAAEINFEAYETKAAGDATAATSQALRSGVETIAVVGGDGTLSEAAEGFFSFNREFERPANLNPDASLAILPAGTGDDFARGLKGSRAPLQHWIDTFVSHCRGTTGQTVPVDVLYGRSSSFEAPFICLNAATMGIGGETAARVAAQGKFLRNFRGEFRFLLAAIGALAVWRERRVRVTVDGREIADGPMNLVGVGNALYAGGGMKLTPGADIADGKLDVLTASGLSRAEIMLELSRVHNGDHVKNRKVKITQGKSVRIETFHLDAMPLEVDGNVRGTTPAQFEVLPTSLRFVV